VLSQSCESRQALNWIADKWTCLIVYALLDGPRRHGELKRMIEGISQKMLTQTLRSTETRRARQTHRHRGDPAPRRIRPAPLGRTCQTPSSRSASGLWITSELQTPRQAHTRAAALA
jgi:DNA-binding HxlR family transcriptional regulator